MPILPPALPADGSLLANLVPLNLLRLVFKPKQDVFRSMGSREGGLSTWEGGISTLREPMDRNTHAFRSEKSSSRREQAWAKAMNSFRQWREDHRPSVDKVPHLDGQESERREARWRDGSDNTSE